MTGKAGGQHGGLKRTVLVRYDCSIVHMGEKGGEICLVPSFYLILEFVMDLKWRKARKSLVYTELSTVWKLVGDRFHMSLVDATSLINTVLSLQTRRPRSWLSKPTPVMMVAMMVIYDRSIDHLLNGRQCANSCPRWIKIRLID